MFKTAFVYAGFLGLSANLRYQAIAGIVEHWIADYFLASEPLVGTALSFAARIANLYFGTRQRVDLALMTGLQCSEDERPPLLLPEVQDPHLESNSSLESSTSTLEDHVDAVLVHQEADPARTP